MEATAVRPYLSQEEIDEICDPLKNPAAQIRYLLREGILVTRKPNGRPLVMRSELERVKGAGRFAQPAQNGPSRGQPNQAALLQLLQGGKNGAKAQGR